MNFELLGGEILNIIAPLVDFIKHNPNTKVCHEYHEYSVNHKKEALKIVANKDYRKGEQVSSLFFKSLTTSLNS